MIEQPDIERRLAFVKRAERLKDTLRSGYTAGGRVESVADHTWRLTLLIITFADLMPGVDLLRLLRICILHDLGEAIDGDIPAPSQVGVASKSEKERADFESLLEGLPEPLRADFSSLWDDYEYVQSDEARIAQAFDKIETIVQHNQGRNPSDFDFSFNLDYGRKYTDAVRLSAAIRTLVDKETRANSESSRERS
ncbi:MAG: HD domain-containing protein [Fuerstiella sp.]